MEYTGTNLEKSVLSRNHILCALSLGNKERFGNQSPTQNFGMMHESARKFQCLTKNVVMKVNDHTVQKTHREIHQSEMHRK